MEPDCRIAIAAVVVDVGAQRSSGPRLRYVSYDWADSAPATSRCASDGVDWRRYCSGEQDIVLLNAVLNALSDS